MPSIISQDIWYEICTFLYADDFRTMRLVIKDIPCDLTHKVIACDMNYTEEDVDWMCKHEIHHRIPRSYAEKYPMLRAKWPILEVYHFLCNQLRYINVEFACSDPKSAYKLYTCAGEQLSVYFVNRLYDVFCRDPHVACDFAVNVTKDRLYNAEDCIMSNRRARTKYINKFYHSIKRDRIYPDELREYYDSMFPERAAQCLCASGVICFWAAIVAVPVLLAIGVITIIVLYKFGLL